MGTNYGTNYLIETIALVKALKSKYSKVIILGISEGGYTALLNLLNTEPDGAIISGGYSINFDTYTPSQFILSARFRSTPQYYDRDSVKSKISQLQTNTLFTWGESDDVTLMDPEHDFHYTENFLNNYSNCSYFYDFNYHTFPPCGTLDSFITRIKGKPKAFIIPIENTCRSDSMQIKVGICGQAPFQFDIYKDNVLLSTVNTANDTSILSLFTEGTYEIKNVDDASSYGGINSTAYTFTKDPAVAYTITGRHFNCDSNNTEIQMQMSGSAPWKFVTEFNNNTQIDTLYNPTLLKHYANGTLTLVSVVDSNSCLLPINQTFILSDSLVDFAINATAYNCDSNKTKISFSLQGRSPWMISYKKNGINDSIITQSSTLDLFLENGLYEFLQVTDSNGCQKNINQVFNFNYNAIDATITTQNFDCDSIKTPIQMDLNGNAPFTIEYTKNGTSNQMVTNNLNNLVHFGNGTYQFIQVTDQTGCVKTINQNFSFNFDTLQFSMDLPQYDCDSNKTKIHFDLQGNTPWTIHYTKKWIPLQINTNTPSLDHLFENGVYQFIQLNDATCQQNINQTFIFDFDTVNISLSQPVYYCDSNKTSIQFDFQGNPPFTIHYTKDATAQQFVTNSFSEQLFFENGNYLFLDVVDASGCLKNISQSHIFNFDTVDITLSTPQFNCDSNKTLVHFDLEGNTPWTIHYLKDGLPQQFVSNNASIDQYYTNGNYQFVEVLDATNCSKAINAYYVFNYDTIGAILSSPLYDCDSNKTAIQCNLSGNAPFEVHYTHDALPLLFNIINTNSTLYFENGNYAFQQVTDATGCQFLINQNYSFSYDTLDIEMTTPQYDCDSHKVKIHFTLEGNSPWTVHYSKDGIPQQLVSNTDNFYSFYENGTYQFISITDATNCSKTMSEYYVFNYEAINAFPTTPIYHCDSNKTAIDFALQGNPPFTIHYTLNGLPLQLNSAIGNFTEYFENGNYNFLFLEDATACSLNLNQNYSFNYDSIDITMSQPQYFCDSNKTKIHFSLQGNSPWVLHYIKDGIPLQFTSNSAQFDLYFSNGLYQFTKIEDATNCLKTINLVYSFNYTPLNAIITQQKFNCDSNLFQIDLQLQGNGPWTIYYNDGMQFLSKSSNIASTSLWLPNGNWTISKIVDATNCEFTLNLNKIINYNAIAVSSSLPVYDCDSNKMRVNFSITGNAPWTIQYTHQNIPPAYYSIQTNNPNHVLYFNNGSYVITDVHDSTNCSQNILLSVNNSFTPLMVQKNPDVYNCDSTKMLISYVCTGDAPYTIHYKNNGNGITYQMITNQPNIELYLGDGNYTILSITDSKCSKSINDTIVINYPKLMSSMAPAAISCDSDKVYVQFATPQGNKPFTYFYYFNNQYLSFTTYSNATNFYLNNGQYFFEKVVDSMGCAVNFNQIVNANYVPYHYNGFTKKYLCDKDSTALTFDVSNAMKVFISYTYNGGPIDSFAIEANGSKTFILPNGSYTLLSITDLIGCVQNINETLIIDNKPTAVDYTISMNCATRSYTYQFDLQGTPPWSLNYNYQNISQNAVINQSPFAWTVDAGLYFLDHIKDANGCEYLLKKSDTLPFFINDFPTLSYRDYRLHTIQTPYSYYWYKDEILIDSISKASIPSYGNGVYKVMIVDHLGCSNWSNEITLSYPKEINVFPNPVRTSTHVVIDGDFGGSWSYQLFDVSGKLLQEGNQEIPSADIDMQPYSSGVYTIIVRYVNQGDRDKNVIRLIKE
ncbi:MAG: T9SS type A sorting domain-containing protein [Bacteroidetes bacterium]|nr:T9SS type A sorting domain-containing protein [Bacteroidota bacterium]